MFRKFGRRQRGGKLQGEEDLCGILKNALRHSCHVLLCGFVIFNGRDTKVC